MAIEHSYEAMDLFYLGREIDPASGKTTTRPLLYKNKNLTTHAAIIGMTGSGKTGLGIGLLEEAAIDKIPAIVIDPKGDMGNLLLTFPQLAAEDFLPWIDEDKAARQGISREELATKTAATWRDGLAAWDQDGERITRMRQNARFTIYTPGSGAGMSVSVLDSLDAPPAGALADSDTLTALVNSAVSSLFALIGIKGDPLQSREHILLSSIILHHWRAGNNLDLQALVRSIVDPPLREIGAFPLDSFYPQAKRMDLAMLLNNILASPSFQAWTKGEPLRMENFLGSVDGKARISIFSLAHLSDQERMFFVTMLLGRLISWLRRQEGAAGLRRLLYMDEIFGYFPPVGNPPSKEPMLLLLKQARAYGLGVVLSTQNPVDLDYKGLANIGTWCIGRLQTRQDQDRVLTGMAAGDGRFDREGLRTLLSDMRERTFLLRSAHLDGVTLFESRWALSFLKGPLSLAETERLRNSNPVAGDDATVPDSASTKETISPAGGSPHPPILSGAITQYFLPSPLPGAQALCTPFLLGRATVRFFNQKRAIDLRRDVALRLELNDSFQEASWKDAVPCPLDLATALPEPPPDILFAPLPGALAALKSPASLEKSLTDHLYRDHSLQLLRVAALKLESSPGENREQFLQRVNSALATKKETESLRIEERFRLRQQLLETRMQKAQLKVDKEQGEVTAKTMDTVITFGMAALGAFLGNKTVSLSTASRTSQGVRAAGRVLKEKGDVERAREEAQRISQEISNLAASLQQELAALNNACRLENYPLEEIPLTPRKTDIFDVQVCLVWEPRLALENASFADLPNIVSRDATRA